MRLRGSTVVLAAIVAVAAISLPVIAQGAVRVFVDGSPVAFDQPPVIQGSRVLVPLRGIFEQMGATVEWRPQTRTVLAARASTLVELQIGSRIARVDGRPVTLDVPAAIIGARTLVPLRFISESLGATVTWQPETRTVLITSGTGGQPAQQPPVTQPPAPPQTSSIRGTITNVILAQSAQDQPRIVVESGTVAYTLRINTDTAITRIDSASGRGGAVGVAALRPGDEVEVTLSGEVATRIRATTTETSGRIEAIASTSRTIVLTDGRAIRFVPNLVVLANGQVQAGGVAALRAGQVVELRLNPSTKEAWEANIITGAAQIPTSDITLTVTEPREGQTVGSPIRVSGTTAAGSRVEVAVSWFLGVPVGRGTATAGPRGRFSMQVPINVIAPNSPYLITVTSTHSRLGQAQRQFTVLVGPEAGR
ncbi:MAG TPA: stalk domain-containing protein [bacterium]|nr:stalk domain-containing protein [bacterium]